MNQLDAVAPNYLRSVERWSDAPLIQGAYDGLLHCYQSGSYGLVEHVKSFIENVCHTIIVDFGVTTSESNPSLSNILNAALTGLGYERSFGESKLGRVVSSFNKLANSLNELRNDAGTVAHGKDGFIDLLHVDHTRAFLHVGDSILGLLLAAEKGAAPNLQRTRDRYERFGRANRIVDRGLTVVGAEVNYDEIGETLSVKIAIEGTGDLRELVIEPSRLLYWVDRAAYIDVLQNSVTAVELESLFEPEVVEDPIVVQEFFGRQEFNDSPASSEEFSEVNERVAAVVTDVLRTTLSSGPSPDLHVIKSLTAQTMKIFEQTWGVDWSERDQLQSMTTSRLARAYRRFGLDKEVTKKTTELLVKRVRQAVIGNEVA